MADFQIFHYISGRPLGAVIVIKTNSARVGTGTELDNKELTELRNPYENPTTVQQMNWFCE